MQNTDLHQAPQEAITPCYTPEGRTLTAPFTNYNCHLNNVHTMSHAKTHYNGSDVHLGGLVLLCTFLGWCWLLGWRLGLGGLGLGNRNSHNRLLQHEAVT